MNSLNLKLNNLFAASSIPSKKLMIMLHGRGDSSYGLTGIPPYFQMEDMNYLLLDAPYEYYGGRSWYALPPHQEEGIVYSSEILTEILDELFEEELAHSNPKTTFKKTCYNVNKKCKNY